MRWARFLVAAGLVLVISSGCVLSDAARGRSGAVSSTKELAPGLEYRRADRGASRGPVKWFVSLGVIRNSAEANRAALCASRLQLQPRLEKFVFPGSRPAAYDEMTLGEFSTRAAVRAYLDQHSLGLACTPEIKASGLYPADQMAPFVVHVLNVDPSHFRGRLIVARADGHAFGRVKPSTLMRQEKALAATNGGFFVEEPTDGIVGESTGISVIAGSLQSEPTKGRPWVMIENSPKIRATLHNREPADLPALNISDGRRIKLDGLNREPGVLRNCGALLDKKSSTAIHDFTCRPPNEIIALTGDGAINVKLVDGSVAYRLKQNHPLVATAVGFVSDPREILLIATGERRSELETVAASQQPVHFTLGTFGIGGRSYALNGGPVLLSGGRIVNSEDVQGWPFTASSLELANAMHRFINLRAPRTALGITASGRILIVVVDGWRYRRDDNPPVPMNGGMTIEELTHLMRDLGALDAINLDGGGSSVMALKAGIVSHPSDNDGERAVGDSLLLMPTRRR